MTKDTKRCRKCHQEVALSLFGRDRNQADGYNRRCKPCLGSKKMQLGSKTERRCSDCKVVKPLEEFNRAKDNALGREYRCRECLVIYQARRRKAMTPEQRETQNETIYAWRRRNPEAWKAIRKRMYDRHAPRIILASKERKYRLKSLRNQAGYQPITAAFIQALRSLQGNRCYYCRKPFGSAKGDVHLEHKIPLSRGGGHTKRNLCLACPRCNLTKHDKTPEEFTQWLQNQAAKAGKKD